MKELLFLLVLFVSNVIQAITGFAGAVLAMPPSVYLLGLDHAKVILNAMAWLSGLMIAVTGYRHINWKELFNNRSKNSLTSIGDGMNCTFEHVCSNS